jgi:hypothetical protein
MEPADRLSEEGRDGQDHPDQVGADAQSAAIEESGTCEVEPRKEDVMIQSFLLIFAVVCFVLSAWPAAAPHWNRLVGAGLAFFAASFVRWPL